MSRFSVLLVVTVFALLAFAPVADATHEWGHRYMIFGRVVDSEGAPAQGVPVYITVETTKQTDPWMIVNTGCDGTYYSLEQSANPQRGGGLEMGRMHIHNAELPSDGAYTIRVLKDENEDYAERTGTVRPQLKYSTVNIQLDEQTPVLDECAAAEDLDRQFIVAGHVQKDEGNSRADLMTVEEAGLYNEVEVTLETANGTRNLTLPTNQFGDYIAKFDNVSVAEGAKVTTRWNDETRESTVSGSDVTYRVAELNVVVREGFGGGAFKVILYIIGAVVVIGAVAFGVSKVRENLEHKRLRQTTVRKRANK